MQEWSALSPLHGQTSRDEALPRLSNASRVSELRCLGQPGCQPLDELGLAIRAERPAACKAGLAAGLLLQAGRLRYLQVLHGSSDAMQLRFQPKPCCVLLQRGFVSVMHSTVTCYFAQSHLCPGLLRCRQALLRCSEVSARLQQLLLYVWTARSLLLPVVLPVSRPAATRLLHLRTALAVDALNRSPGLPGGAHLKLKAMLQLLLGMFQVVHVCQRVLRLPLQALQGDMLCLSAL